MRMHDPGLGDPVIEQPEPITLFLPILEASLRRAGIPASIRLLLDATTTCMEGVTPVGLELHESWR